MKVRGEKHKEQDLELVPLLSVFRDPELERRFLQFRRSDDVRAASLALLLGGLAYAGAGVTDATVFQAFPEQLVTVRLLRLVGVCFCLGGAALVWKLGTTFAVHLFSAVGMLGTLLTYSGIAYLEETLVGQSDYRMVFSVFSLLAFIFFPIRIALSMAMVAFMLLNVTVLSLLLSRPEATALPRTLVLMVTFSVAGASFSTTNQRARRKEFELRRRREEAMQELSREIEARRRVEAELQKHRDHLEELVKARTAALEKSQAQLVTAQRVEALGQLAGGLAHDFNNLLVTIMGNAELSLASPQVSDGIRRNQENILEASERASKLARDLLAGSRKQVMEFDLLDLGELVQGMTGILDTAVGKRAHLTIHTAQTPALNGARGPLEQVLLNLIVNARDAAEPHGLIEVRVDARELAKDDAELPPQVSPGNFVRIAVSDTGPGIAEEIRERVFEPFFSTKPDGHGTGLGLSVVKGVIEQHGGFIRLDTKVDVGSTFTVHLPAHEGVARQKSESGLRSIASGGHERILIVDDEPLVVQLLKTTLEKAGYEIAVAGDGAEAFERLSQDPRAFDLVLSDLVMQPVGGKALMEQVRAQGNMVPFLFSSGYSDGGVHRGFVLDAGISFIAKPFRTSELKDKIRTVLDQASRNRAKDQA